MAVVTVSRVVVNTSPQVAVVTVSRVVVNYEPRLTVVTVSRVVVNYEPRLAVARTTEWQNCPSFSHNEATLEISAPRKSTLRHSLRGK